MVQPSPILRVLSGILVFAFITAIRSAPLIPRETFQPRSFAATSWPGAPDSSDLRIFFPMADGSTIQELISIPNQPGTEWARGSRLTSGGAFEIPSDTVMTASAISSQIRVFFYDATNNLREFVWDGTGWKVGSLAYNLGSHPRKLTSAAWVDPAQVINFSIYFVNSAGEMYEGNQAGSAPWTFNKVGNAAGDGGMFARIWVDQGVTKKRIYYQDTSADNSLRESTWNLVTEAAASIWSGGIPTGFPFAPSGAMSLAGAVIPSDGQERIFVNPSGSQDVIEYTRGGAQIPQSWSPGTHKLPVTAQQGAPLQAVGYIFKNKVLTTDAISVFSLASTGSLTQTKYMSNGRPQWSTFSTEVTVF